MLYINEKCDVITATASTVVEPQPAHAPDELNRSSRVEASLSCSHQGCTQSVRVECSRTWVLSILSWTIPSFSSSLIRSVVSCRRPIKLIFPRFWTLEFLLRKMSTFRHRSVSEYWDLHSGDIEESFSYSVHEWIIITMKHLNMSTSFPEVKICINAKTYMRENSWLT